MAADSVPKVLLAQPGTQHVQDLAEQLERCGMLKRLATGLLFSDESWAARLWGGRLRQAFDKRFVCVPAGRLLCRPWLELSALIRVKTGGDENDIFFERNRRFQEELPEALLHSADIVVGFDTASWILAERAGECGKPFVLDQSALHHLLHNDVMRASYAGDPAFAELLLLRPEEQLHCFEGEPKAADAIVCASSFSKRSLLAAGAEENKIHVIPYGVRPVFNEVPRAPRSGKPRFLYAGMLSLRKGIPFLAESLRLLAGVDFELVLAGSGPLLDYPPLRSDPRVRCLGSISQQALAAEMARADAFVFPTVSDGFAFVVLEAMRTGLPVIATEHCCAPDIIENGRDGLIVPAADAGALADAMRRFLALSDRGEAMGRAARETSREFTWQRYGDRWASLLCSL